MGSISLLGDGRGIMRNERAVTYIRVQFKGSRKHPRVLDSHSQQSWEIVLITLSKIKNFIKSIRKSILEKLVGCVLQHIYPCKISNAIYIYIYIYIYICVCVCDL